MKHICTLFFALALAACASPRDAKIENGKIENITSAEATTLMKGEQRRAKVEDVQKNQKPIFKVTAKPGEDIVFKGVASLEINTPLDLSILLAEQASETSENVQMVREVRQGLKDVAVPLGLGAIMLNDRNNQRSSNERIAESNNTAATAQAAAQASTTNTLVNALTASQQATINAIESGADTVAP